MLCNQVLFNFIITFTESHRKHFSYHITSHQPTYTLATLCLKRRDRVVGINEKMIYSGQKVLIFNPDTIETKGFPQFEKSINVLVSFF